MEPMVLSAMLDRALHRRPVEMSRERRRGRTVLTFRLGMSLAQRIKAERDRENAVVARSLWPRR